MKKINFRKKIALSFYGIVLALILLEITLNLAGLAYAGFQIPDYDFSQTTNKTFNIVCFGDSYTWGVGAGFRNSYPAQLQKILNSNNPDKKFKVYNLGVPGYNSHQVLLRLTKCLKSIRPDLVIILAGTNDYLLFNNDLLFSLQYINEKKDSVFNRLKTVKLLRIALTNFQRWANPTENRINNIKQIALTNMSLPPEKSLPPEALTKQITNTLNSINQDPANETLYIKLDSLLVRQNNISKSIEIYSRLSKKFPDNALITTRLAGGYKHLAGSFLVDNKYQQAAIYYQKAAAADKNKQNQNQYIEMIRHLTVFHFNYQNLKEMIEICENKNIPVMISGQPEFTLMPAEHIAKNQNIPLIRHGASFKRLLKDHPKNKFFIADGHCTKQGYHVMAQNAAEEIIARFNQ